MIYVVFKIAKTYACNLSLLITFNYLTATLLGFTFFVKFNFELIDKSKSFLPVAMLLGVLFVIMFFLIGKSSQKAGITVTTLANKLSLIFPVLFSILYFNETISPIKYIGIFLAILAVFLTLFKNEIKRTNLLYIVLPLSIFFGSGIVDSIVKYIQELKINENQIPEFTSFVFLTSFVFCIIILLLKKTKSKLFHVPTLLLGILLGSANFGSLYFIINALNKSNLSSYQVFTINNMSIVALSAVIGALIFHEKLKKINYIGILLALLSLYFLL